MKDKRNGEKENRKRTVFEGESSFSFHKFHKIFPI